MKLRFIPFFLLLFLPLAAQEQAPAAQAPAPKPGYKEIPFGTPKDGMMRRLTLAHNFKQINQKWFEQNGMGKDQFLDRDSACVAKIMLGDREIMVKFHFNKDNRFSAFTFFLPGQPESSFFVEIKEGVAFFSKVFREKYGPALEKKAPSANEAKAAGMSVFMKWEKGELSIVTGVLCEEGAYFAFGRVTDRNLAN